MPKPQSALPEVASAPTSLILRILIGKYDVFADEISLPSTIALLKSYTAGKLSFHISAAEWPQTFES